MIVPQLNRFTYWSDETAAVSVFASHYSTAEWTNAQAQVSEAGEKLFQADVSTVKHGEVRELGQVSWKLSEQSESLDLHIENGTALAQNTVSILVLPAEARRAAFAGEVAAILRPNKTNPQIDSWLASASSTPTNVSEGLVDDVDRLPGIGELLRGSGYKVKRTISAATKLVISDQPTTDVLDWVKAGGDLLYFANSAGSPFFWVHGRGGNYSGRWITTLELAPTGCIQTYPC